MAITPDTLLSENMGTLRLVIAQFTTAANGDDGETWASGLTGVIDFWTQCKNDPTQTSEGMEVTESSGTFTFNMAEDNKAFSLFVLTRN
jgi:hypothetical protein